MRADEQRAPTIAIIGAGASGTLAAIHLLRHAQRPLNVVLFDRRSQPGRGVAYGTTHAEHLLNVRASNMSALPGDPAHFLEWLHTTGDDALRAAEPTDFVPRLVYARYLEATLQQAQGAAAAGVSLVVRDAEVVGVASDQTALHLGDGSTFAADRSVLALGNFAPHSLVTLSGGRAPSDPDVYENPWDAAALDGLDPSGAVLLVGTGLTMVDLVVSLVIDRGHQGPIYAVSRRGLLPQMHAAGTGYAHTWAEADLPTDAVGLLRRLRAAIRLATQQGHDWRGVVDSLRPVTQATWQRAPLVERGRFLRHLQPFWDTHRHRVAPRIGRVLADAQIAGQLSVRAGRLARIERTPAGLRVEIGLRSGGTWTAEVARVINCTGPAVDAERLNEPLIASLIAHGLARPDPLRLGLATTTDGRLVEANGDASQRVFGLGPVRRGELWETTSVPDIRVQAERLAEVLVGELGLAANGRIAER